MTGKDARPRPGCCAVVVTYHPDESVTENLRAAVAECAYVIVVDNASGPDDVAAFAAVAGVSVIALPGNVGLAAALNVGVGRAAEQGYEWVLTLDQDSRPEPGMTAALWATHLTLPRAAVIGPRIHEENSDVRRYRWVRRSKRWPLCFQRAGTDGEDLPEVTMVVTSGSMIEIELWRKLGGFDEALFIDYIDTDYCLRVIRAGRSVAVAGGGVLHHRLGARERRMLMGREFRPTHHAAFRHYYIARNRVMIWRRHALAVPHWAVFDFCFAVFNTARVLLFERDRGAKMAAMLRGTWHGLLGRGGPIH
jgi:rhamnosyltransferase